MAADEVQLPGDALAPTGEEVPSLASTEPELPKPDLAAGDTTPVQPAPEVKLAANQPKSAKAPPAAPLPTEAAATAAPSTDPGLAAKAAALEKTRQAAAEAEKLHQDMLKQQQQAEAAAAEAKKSLEAKTKASAPLMKWRRNSPRLARSARGSQGR
jgi:hypothetical protein